MRTSFLSALGVFAIGCASQPAPHDQIASSLAAVRGAEEAGAQQVPEAALHVKLAQEQIEQAQALMADDDNERAGDLAVRAYQDAELAIALARENEAKRRLEQVAQANSGSGGEQPGAPLTAPAGSTGSDGASAPGTTQPSGLQTQPRSQTVTD
jgi:pyridoxal biosynthesis lyase PdxS